MAKIEIDEATGVQTTGHSWDGIKELDNPLPRWWVMTYLVTIVFAVVYLFLYPSWPTGTDSLDGSLGYTERQAVADQLQAAKDAQSVWLSQIAETPLAEIQATPDLHQFALRGGKAAFDTNCAGCHGVGGGGQLGKYPVLADDDWIWGGSIEEIYTTVAYGVRSDHAQTRFNEMPSFGADGILTKQQILSLAGFVQGLAEGKGSFDSAAGQLFQTNCAACHGAKGEGRTALGAPALNDFVWLYGNDLPEIVNQISRPQQGIMPAFGPRIDDATLRMLAVYVHGLGGGE